MRAVILRALGPVFSSGHDLRELTNGVEEDYASTFSQATEVMEAIRLLPQPVIARSRPVKWCKSASSC